MIRYRITISYANGLIQSYYIRRTKPISLQNLDLHKIVGEHENEGVLGLLMQEVKR